MSDPIRTAAERLLQQLDQRRASPDSPLFLERAEDELRAALAAPTPPAGRAAKSDRLPPKIGHVFQLAAIICNAITEADTKITDPTTLAQKILSDPRSQWAPAQEGRDHD